MDKRISKSIIKIKNAYKELLFNVEPNEIQVKELCKEAKVNRSTFYDRFGFLDNLEKEIIEEEMNDITFSENQIDQLKKEVNGIDKDIIKKYIEYFSNNKVLVRFCTVNGREKYINIIAQIQVKLCASELTKISYYDAYFQVIGALSMIIEWINNKQNHSINDIVDIVHAHSIAMFNKKEMIQK